MNDCKFTGRFTAAPRRVDTEKTSRCFFTLMVNKIGKRADGTKHPAQAVDFVAWGATADLICQYKDKGHLVLVTAEYSTYETNPIDMNNQPLANARKVNKPIFTVREVEFMPVNGTGQASNYNNNNQSANNSNINPADIPTYNAEEFPVEPINNAGALPFDLGQDDDPFALADL